MLKICSVQVEILLAADEKALLDHYVKEQNQRYKNGATELVDTGETVTVTFDKRYNLPGGSIAALGLLWQKLS